MDSIFKFPSSIAEFAPLCWTGWHQVVYNLFRHNYNFCKIRKFSLLVQDLACLL